MNHNTHKDAPRAWKSYGSSNGGVLTHEREVGDVAEVFS